MNYSTCSLAAGACRQTWLKHFTEMAGFRNILVHGYDEVDLAVVRDIIEHRLEDLLAFVRFVRARVA